MNHTFFCLIRCDSRNKERRNEVLQRRFQIYFRWSLREEAGKEGRENDITQQYRREIELIYFVFFRSILVISIDRDAAHRITSRPLQVTATYLLIELDPSNRQQK
ncbi:hypothetical protein V1478_008407 [Vespula squamosa]|uniref:Uncharacterized protein n=1 Tax=Vespula squamosa TaxID=30214 RepID=A0ABD2ATF0_VESSQ